MSILGMLSNIVIREIPQWEENGPEDDPASRLLGQVVFLGIDFFVEAYQVNTDGAIAGEWFQEELDAIYTPSGAEGDPIRSITINERNYLVILLFASEHSLPSALRAHSSEHSDRTTPNLRFGERASETAELD
jgi:hypothetical protein